MKVNDSIIEKIRKCLGLANGLNATPAEMEAAMAKAKEIALRHSIELASVALSNPEESNMGVEIGKDTSLKIRSQYMQPYHRWVSRVLQECFEVRVIYHKNSCYGGTRISQITLIGEATDVAIARELFGWLESIFPKTLSTAVRERRLTYCAAHTNGCYAGLAHGLMEANRRAQKTLTPTENNTLAMVLVKKTDLIEAAVAEEFPQLKSAKERSKEMSSDAYYHGLAKGKQIKLNQMGTTTRHSVLA